MAEHVIGRSVVKRCGNSMKRRPNGLKSYIGNSGALPSLDRADVVGKAQRTLLLARRKSIVNERTAYAQELPSYEATRELLRLQLDEAVRCVNRAEKQAAAWNEAVESATQQLADAQAQDARRKLITTRGELIPLAQENQRIAGLRSGPDSPSARLKRVTARVAEVKRMLVRVKAEFAHVRQVADLSKELGQVLVREKRELPDLEALEEGLREQQEEIARAKLALFDLEDRRTQLADVDAEAHLALMPLNATLSDEEREELEPAVRELLQTRRGYLDDLISDYNAYFNALVMEQDKTERELTQTVRLYRDYIDQRVLWVPSYAPQTGVSAAAFTAASLQIGQSEELVDGASAICARHNCFATRVGFGRFRARCFRVERRALAQGNCSFWRCGPRLARSRHAPDVYGRAVDRFGGFACTRSALVSCEQINGATRRRSVFARVRGDHVGCGAHLGHDRMCQTITSTRRFSREAFWFTDAN